MHTSYSVSKYLACIILLLSAVSIPCKAKTGILISGLDGYSIMPEDDNSRMDNKWAEYMLLQSGNRIKDKSIIGNRKNE